jgi:hypothetical protein
MIPVHAIAKILGIDASVRTSSDLNSAVSDGLPKQSLEHPGFTVPSYRRRIP